MRASVEHGWLSVPCDAGDVAVVHIAVGDTPEVWVPAFRDYDGAGRRTAQIPWDVGHELQIVWLRVDGIVQRVGVLRA